MKKLFVLLFAVLVVSGLHAQQKSDLPNVTIKDLQGKDVNIAKPEDVTDEEIEFLKDNIEKLTELKKKTEKVVKKISNQEITSYWNGQSYDF